MLWLRLAQLVTGSSGVRSRIIVAVESIVEFDCYLNQFAKLVKSIDGDFVMRKTS